VADKYNSNWPKYKDPTGVRNVAVDPFIIRQIVNESKQRGYDPDFTMALAGAETNFGTYGHGPNNPLSYKWKVTDDRKKLIDEHPVNKQLKNTITGLIADGMPEGDAIKLDALMRARQVMPAVAITKAFDTLDEKKLFLNTSPKSKAPASPARLAWLYQGNGTIGEEAPSGIAYGKPVSKTSPTSDHANLVQGIMRELKNKDNPLGAYIRGIK